MDTQLKKRFAKWLADALMKKNGGNASELARNLSPKVSPQTVQQWLAAETIPRPHRIQQIVDYVGEPIPQDLSLSAYSAFSEETPTVLNAGALKYAPVLSWESIRESMPMTVEQPKGAYDARPCPVSSGSGTFVLKISGMSMEPAIRDGEEVFVDPQREPNHGDMVIADHPAWPVPRVRLFQREGGSAYVRAINPQWPEPPTLSDNDLTIIGVVIYVGRQVG